MSCYLLPFEKAQTSSDQLNSKNNGPVLLLTTRHCRCFQLSVAKDDKDGYGLKLLNIGLTFSRLNAHKKHQKYE